MGVIKKYYEVIEKTLSLLDTMEEGITHIKIQLSELRYEEAFNIQQDVVEGIASIENAIEPMFPKLQENNIESMTAILKENISKVVACYERGEGTNLHKQVEEIILPAFKNWKEELEKVLKPYIVS